MKRTTLPRLTDRLPLGESELQVNPVCPGQVRDPKLVPAAFEAGINFFYNSLRAGARVDLFPYLTRPTSTLLYNFTTTQGHVPEADWQKLELPDLGWRPTITDHYRFVLTRPEMDGLLVSFTDVAHVGELARALEQGPLSAEEEGQMLELGALVRHGARR